MSVLKVSEQENYVHVEIQKSPTSTDIEALKGDISKSLLHNKNNYILDLRFVMEFIPQVSSVLINFSRDLKKNNKVIYTVNAKGNVKSFLKEQGLDSTFNLVDSLEVALSQIKKKSSLKIDTNFLNPFVNSTIETFQTQVNLSVKVEKPTIRMAPFEDKLDIAGIINVKSEQFKGSISLCLTKNVFLSVYEKMLGEKHTEINEETKDACAEILNIIFGNAKAKLNSQFGYSIDKAIPIVQTSNFKLDHIAKPPLIILPITSSSGGFYLQIAVSQN